MTCKKTQNLEKKFNGKKSLDRKTSTKIEKHFCKKDNFIIGGIFALLIGILVALCLFVDTDQDNKVNTEWLNNLTNHY